MKLQVNPVTKVGSLNRKPNWRIEAICNPAKYKLQDLVFQPTSGSGCLKRYISYGIEFEVNYKIPSLLKYYQSQLDKEESDLLFSLWERSFKREGKKKVFCTTNQKFFKKNSCWKTKDIGRISDTFLKRLVLHQTQLKYDPYISYALTIANSDDHKEIFRFIGYCIYAKVSDIDIAKRWKIKLKQVEALHKLFFDFDNFPTDRLANLTCLRQMTYSGLFDEDDFAYYKRAFDLGELGIRAQTDFHGLSDDEKRIVQEYLGRTVIENTLNINFSIKTQKDALAYVNVIGNLANHHIKEAEIENIKAKTENIKVTTKRLEGQMVSSMDDISLLDQKFMEILRDYSLQEIRPIHKSIQDLE